MKSLPVRSLVLAVSGALICAAQTAITIQPASPVPSISERSTAEVTLGGVASVPSGVSFTLNSFDPNAWLAFNGSCSTQNTSLLISTPQNVVACISPNMTAGLHYLFYDVTSTSQTYYFALPLNVTPQGSLTLNSSNFNITAPTTTANVTVTAATDTTINSVTESYAQPGVGNWLSVPTSCNGLTSCNAVITVTPGNLVSPATGATYIGKVTFTASDGTVAEAEVQYTYEPTTVTPITITSASSFTGFTNEFFTTTLSAKGGTPPYTWTATSLPSGLSISSAGVITGTVTSANTYMGTVKVTDSNGSSQSENITLNFENAATAVPTQIFPHMAADTTWQTNFLIFNTTSTPIAFTLKFHPDSGGSVAIAGQGKVNEITGTIPARGSASYTTAATTDSDGWAELDSPTSLQGVATFTETGSQASVLLSAPGTTFTVPFGGASGTLDGLAVANADPANQAKITCQAYDNNGNTIAGSFTLVTLAASSHTAFLLQQAISGLPAGTAGQLACSSTTGVGVVELLAIGSEVSTLPVVMGQ